MKNHRFPWLRNRTTDNRKCEKARNIKEKRTIEMFNTVSKQLVEHLSSLNDNFNRIQKTIKTSESLDFPGFFFTLESLWDVQKCDGNLWICSKYAARMHQKSQQLCGQI